MIRIEGARYYTIPPQGDEYFALKVCGKKGTRNVRDFHADLELNTYKQLRIIAHYLQLYDRSKLNKLGLLYAITESRGRRQCCENF